MNKPIKSKMEILQEIVDQKQAQFYQGMLVDLFTASAIVGVYNSLKKEENKEKYKNLPIQKMATIAFKLLK